MSLTILNYEVNSLWYLLYILEALGPSNIYREVAGVKDTKEGSSSTGRQRCLAGARVGGWGAAVLACEGTAV